MKSKVDDRPNKGFEWVDQVQSAAAESEAPRRKLPVDVLSKEHFRATCMETMEEIRDSSIKYLADYDGSRSLSEAFFAGAEFAIERYIGWRKFEDEMPKYGRPVQIKESEGLHENIPYYTSIVAVRLTQGGTDVWRAIDGPRISIKNAIGWRYVYLY